MAAECWPYLFFLNAHNLPIFQLILMKLVYKFMVHRALSDKTYLSLGFLSPLIRTRMGTSTCYRIGTGSVLTLLIGCFEEEKRSGGFAFIVLQMSCYCKCSLTSLWCRGLVCGV